jgi:hypothetical protein
VLLGSYSTCNYCTDSCWAQVACEAVEAALRIYCGISVILSRNELIECCYNPYGDLDVAFTYMTNHGITEEKYYRKVRK